MTSATQRFDVAAMPDVGTLAMETELSLSGLTASSLAGEELGGAPGEREVAKRRRELAEQCSVREMDLDTRTAELDSEMQTTAEQLATRKKKLLERERAIKDENRAAMETVAQQTDYIEQLEHKQVRVAGAV